jgi:hypothetical protein
MLVPLLGGAYEARSIIAEAQRCINLFPENNPKNAPIPMTHYLTPGLTSIGFQGAEPCRWQYTASNGNLYTVTGNQGGSSLYVSTPNDLSEGIASTTLVANFLSFGTTPVYMADNGLVMVLVDGTTDGWAVNLADNSFAQIVDPNFLGASKVDYDDTFFIFNVPGTFEWYISLSEVDFVMLTGPVGAIDGGGITNVGAAYTDGTYTNTALTGGTGSGAIATIIVVGGVVTSVTITTPGTGYIAGDTVSASIAGGSGFEYTVATVGGTAFDPTDIATKSTAPDPIVTLIVMHAEIWLLGTQTTEIWYNAGASDFTFQIFPGIFIEHGCIAPYSVAKQDLNIYWLSTDKQGQGIVIKGNNYAAHRISTYAIEQEFAQYGKLSDAIGWTYQQLGHTYYVLTFPGADKTWVWDENTQLWHERASLQTTVNQELVLDGNLHGIFYNCSGVCGGLVYVGDRIGNIWLLDTNNYTENNIAIPRIRSFPHLLNSQKRVSYKQFIADMECGTDDSTVTNDGTSSAHPPTVQLRMSDDRGKTYGNYVSQSMGALGKYLTNIQWRRLGMARDRVFELSWSTPTKTALSGAWVEFESSST